MLVDEVEVYPAAGMLVTALQAAVQLAITSRVIDGFHSKDVVWKKALVMPQEGFWRGTNSESVLTKLYRMNGPNLVLSKSQIVTGINLPSYFRKRGLEEPSYIRPPMFRPLYQILDSKQPNLNGNTDHSINYRDLIIAPETIEEASDVIVSGLQAKLSKTLAVENVVIDTGKPMHVYGLDSLSAVEIRTWFRNNASTDVAIFEILGNKSINGLAASVAPKSRI